MDDISVAVHDGEFHADDVFAVAVLCRIMKVRFDRTRDKDILKQCDLRVDVGDRSDPEAGDYDHHQEGRAGERPNGVPYAAFGLVWRQFGQQVCSGDTEVMGEVDRRLVQIVDARDNGHDIWTETVDGVTPYTVSNVISDLNPCGGEDRDYNTAFEVAIDLATQILARVITQAQATVEDRRQVESAVAQADDSRIIHFDQYNFKWAGLVCSASAQALYVVYPSEDGTYYFVQCVLTEPDSFNIRKALPENLAGLRTDELAEKSGVNGAIFVHPARFLGGASTREEAVRLAKIL